LRRRRKRRMRRRGRIISFSMEFRKENRSEEADEGQY
jgi:hypothetical protein